MAPRRYSKPVTTAKATVAALSRSRTPDDPELTEARRSLKAANIAAYIERAVAEAPALRRDQLEKIAGLLNTAGGGAA